MLVGEAESEQARRCGRHEDVAEQPEHVGEQDRVPELHERLVPAQVDEEHRETDDGELGVPVRPRDDRLEHVSLVDEVLERQLVEAVRELRLEVDDGATVRERDRRRLPVGDAARDLVEHGEAEPDRELAPKIRPTARQMPAARCDHRGHNGLILDVAVGTLERENGGCGRRKGRVQMTIREPEPASTQAFEASSGFEYRFAAWRSPSVLAVARGRGRVRRGIRGSTRPAESGRRLRRVPQRPTAVERRWLTRSWRAGPATCATRRKIRRPSPSARASARLGAARRAVAARSPTCTRSRATPAQPRSRRHATSISSERSLSAKFVDAGELGERQESARDLGLLARGAQAPRSSRRRVSSRGIRASRASLAGRSVTARCWSSDAELARRHDARWLEPSPA